MENTEITSNGKIAVSNIKSPIEKYASILSLVGFLGAVILSAHTAEVENGGNKLLNILTAFNFIPYWIGALLCLGSIFIFLMYIMKYLEPITKQLRNAIKWYLVILPFYCIVDIMADAMPYNDTIILLGLIIAIIYVIVDIILAFKFISSYTGDIATLGWLFLVETLVGILFIFFAEDAYIWLSLITIVINYYIFANFRSLFISEE